MKKLIGILLVLFLAVWLWPKSKEPVAQHSMQEENLAEDEFSEVVSSTTFRQSVTTTSIVPLTTTTQQLEITTTLQSSTTQTLRYNAVTTTTQELTRRQQRDQKAFELAQNKLKAPIQAEIARSLLFKKWPRNEMAMAGMFQGKIAIDGKEHILRMNLLFNLDTAAIQPFTCAALFSRDKVLFRESYRSGRMGLLNPPERGYILISVVSPSGSYNIELFSIGSRESRIYQANLFVPGKGKQALSLQLTDLQDASPQDRCLQVY